MKVSVDGHLIRLFKIYIFVYIGEFLFTFFASLAYVPLFLLELQNRLL